MPTFVRETIPETPSFTLARPKKVFETGFKEDMDEAEAVELVKQAILAGVFNDLGSGSNVDVTVIRADGETSRYALIYKTYPPIGRRFGAFFFKASRRF